MKALTSLEKNALMCVSIAAIIAWIFPLCVAAVKLIKEYSGWRRERRARAVR